jgi:hypothetical protein
MFCQTPNGARNGATNAATPFKTSQVALLYTSNVARCIVFLVVA